MDCPRRLSTVFVVQFRNKWGAGWQVCILAFSFLPSTSLSEKTPNTGWMARRCTISFLIQNRSKCSRHLHRKVLACRFYRYFRLHDSPEDTAKEYTHTLLLLHRLKADSHSKWHVTVMMVAFNKDSLVFENLMKSSESLNTPPGGVSRFHFELPAKTEAEQWC